MAVALCHHLTVEGKDNLTIGTGLELIVLELVSDVLMIVNLTIDGEHLLLVGREQRLTTALRVYNTKTLMRQYC